MVCYGVICSAQVPSLLQPASTFNQTLNTNLTFSQSSVYDWKEGEKSAFDLKFGANLRLNFEQPSLFRWTSTLKLNVGVQQESSDLFPAGYIKATDNELFGEAVLVFALGWKIDPFISGTFRTQPTESYRLLTSQRIRTAKLWDPVTSQQAIGVAQDIKFGQSVVTLRGGLNLQQIRASRHREQTDNPTTVGIREGYKESAGCEALIDGQIRLDSGITLVTRTTVRRAMTPPVMWNVQSDNEVRCKVWRFLGVLLTYSATYNPQQTGRVQQRFSLSFGVVQDW